MKGSLFKKVFVIVVLLYGLLSVLMTGFSAWNLRDNLRDEFKHEARAIAEGLAGNSVETMNDNNAASIQAMINKTLNLEGVSHVLVRDRNGDILAHTFVPGVPKSLLTDKKTEKTRVREVRHSNGFSGIEVSVPVLSGILGSIHVGMDESVINRSVWKAVKHEILGQSVILACILVIAYFIVQLFTGPLKSMSLFATRLGKGEYSSGENGEIEAQMDKLSKKEDEIGQLAGVFMKMAQDIKKREESLKVRVEELEIQIDKKKRDKEVDKIAGSDFFQDLLKKADKLKGS